ncbi:Cation efflux system protein CusC precursor [compost metagenome]|uniref:Nodulation protein T n=1 Tax=Pseudomonas wadenswilerensis TaxID=1785161 RepID=A0A380T212_9PSED|nr:efflux transporter outer membrane subunit [Pseudomonas wadenswilerensis]SUQ63864.1 Nodulation protein T [Pseudomonas wadenswilerensis]
MNRANLALACVLSSLAVAGCKVGPDYEKATPAPIPLSTPQQQQFAAGAQLPAQWWSFFDDPQLDHLVDTALKHNHDIRQAQANLLAARALFDDRHLDQYPGVTARTGFSQSLEQQQLADGSEPQRMFSRSYRAGFDVQWEIDLFGRLQRLTAAAEARSEAARADLEQMRLSIAAEVARAYYQQQGLRRSLEVAQAQVQAWRETLKLTSAQVRAGSGQYEDEQSAHANLLLSEAAVPPLQASIQEAGYRLDVLTGRAPSLAQEPAQARFLPPLARQLPLGDVNALINNRPDVASAERQLAASSEDVGVATAELYPRLDLGGFIGFFALRSGDLGSAARAYELAPTVTWPAFRLGNAKARLRAAEAQSQGAQARYEQSLLLAREEVENAVTRLARNQTRLGALMQSAAHGADAIDIASKRYRRGAGTYMAVLENQRAFFLIKREVAEAETASYLNAIALYKALGWGSGGVQ